MNIDCLALLPKKLARIKPQSQRKSKNIPLTRGACEVNYELIRRILSKGTTMNRLVQEDIFLMMNHINSYKRKKLNNRTPYEMFSFYYGEELLKKLGCKPVAAEHIILKPRLLKK